MDNLKKIWHKHPPRFWIMLAGVIISLLGFAEIVDDVFSDPQEGDLESVQFDHDVRKIASGLRSPMLTQAMTDLTALGSVSVVFAFVFVLVSVLFSYKDYRGIAYLMVISAGAGIFPSLLKVYFDRERPDSLDHLVNVSDLSFPSGHAFGATAIYFGLAFYSGLYARTWRQEVFFYILGGLLISLVCLSRIYLGVHFPTDVIAGFFGGAVWALSASAVYVLLNQRKANPDQ